MFKTTRVSTIIFALIFAVSFSFIMIGCSDDDGGGDTPTYTVTYDGNGNTGGTVPTDSNNYEQGATVTFIHIFIIEGKQNV